MDGSERWGGRFSQTLCVYVGFFVGARVFVVMCVCLCVCWKGAEGSLFQHQQADESLGPNSLEAELALLFSLFSIFSSQNPTYNLKNETKRALATITS